MKSSYLTVATVFILSHILLPVSAFGIRGAAERVLYYYAYLADDIVQQVTGTTDELIGAGCAADKGGRCTFDEFLSWIWAEGEEGAEGPEFKVLGKKDFLDYKVGRLIDRVFMYGPTGRTNADRVYKGASDFYEALAKVATPIGEALKVTSNLSDDDNDKKNAKLYAGKAKEAVRAVVLLRLQDLEPYRIDRVGEILSVMTNGRVTEVETKDGPKVEDARDSGANKGFQKKVWSTMDRHATVQSIKDNAGELDPDETLRAALKQYKTEPQLDRNRNPIPNRVSEATKHWKAFQAASMSQKLCACA